MRVLVTGGAGFIGSHVVDGLVELGHEVVIVDDLSSGCEENVNPAARLIRHDITNGATHRLIETERPEVVVHAAAQPSVVASVEDPHRDASVNILGGIQVGLGSSHAGVRRLIYLTTGGALYGSVRGAPPSEARRARPLSPYGLSKWTLEQYLSLLLPEPGRVIALRLSNIYGPRQRASGEGGVIAAFCRRIVLGEPVVIHGDGRQSRDFLYVGDAADAVLAVLRAPNDEPGSAVNIGTGTEVSIRDVFAALAALAGQTQPPLFAPPRPGDIRRSCLDVSRARELLGWSASTSLRDGLTATLDWYRAREAESPLAFGRSG